jgi:hypothetical protein
MVQMSALTASAAAARESKQQHTPLPPRRPHPDAPTPPSGAPHWTTRRSWRTRWGSPPPTRHALSCTTARGTLRWTPANAVPQTTRQMGPRTPPSTGPPKPEFDGANRQCNNNSNPRGNEDAVNFIYPHSLGITISLRR